MAPRKQGRKPQKNPIDELVQLAIDLDLTAMAEQLPLLLTAAEKEQPSLTAFVLAALRVEATTRKERRIQRFLKRSHLGNVEGISGFDFSVRPKLDPRIVKELFLCQFVAQHRNILCLGRPGLGKTRIAKALAHAACLAGYSVLSLVTAEMIEDFNAAKADGSYRRALRRYTKPDLLLLDEFGYEPFSQTATTWLFRVVSARHRTGSIVLTSNTGFTRWKHIFPSEAIAVATVDRLVDDATILRFTGKPHRKPREIIGAPLDDE